MSTSKVNIKKLMEQSSELQSLINMSNRIIKDDAPISSLREDYEDKVSDLAPQVWKFAKLAVVTRKNPREMMTVAALVAVIAGVGWAGAAGIDTVRNKAAKARAKKALMGYYQELISKQGMIITEQQRVQLEMSDAIEHLGENEAVYREKIRTLQQRQEELIQLMDRLNNLKQYVEK